MRRSIFGAAHYFKPKMRYLCTKYIPYRMINSVNDWQELLLSPALFWDTNSSKINLDTHARTIVERVVMYGTWAEFRAILEYYGKHRIKEILIDLRYLDNRTLSFCSVYFQVPQTAFRCYILRQSNPTHWHY